MPGTPGPDPQSQSFSRGYGSILPTSLIYIALSTRGCAPWRPDAVMSTTRGENNTRRRIFKGRRRCAEPGRGCPAFPDGAPYRRIIRFQGPPAPSTRTENSRPDRRRRLRPRLRRRSISTSRSGNVDPVPFRQAGRPRPPNLLTGFPYLSGSTHPCPIAVHTEPFSTSVFKVLI